MDRISKLTLGSAVAAAMLSIGSAQAQTEAPVDTVWCRSGTASIVAKDEKMVVLSIDHYGVARSNDPKNLFHNATQRCVGTIATIDGKMTASGWCKTVVAKTGDWTLVDWKSGEKPGQGTWSYRHGTGALKGITGSGTYQSLGRTRPMQTGTYQNCVRTKGTRKIPG
jgi:hypothetical protein